MVSLRAAFLGATAASSLVFACSSFDAVDAPAEPPGTGDAGSDAGSTADAAGGDGPSDGAVPETSAACLSAPVTDSFERDQLAGEGWSVGLNAPGSMLSISTAKSLTGTRSLEVSVTPVDAGKSDVPLTRVLGVDCVSFSFALYLAEPAVSFYVFELETTSTGVAGAPVLGGRVNGSSLTIYEQRPGGVARSLVIIPLATEDWTRIALHYTAAPSLAVEVNGAQFPLKQPAEDVFSQITKIDVGVASRALVSSAHLFLDDVILR